MDYNDWDIAYNSLLSCIVGTISTLDLINIKEVLRVNPTNIVEEYYTRAIEDHCKMVIYHNEWIM